MPTSDPATEPGGTLLLCGATGGLGAALLREAVAAPRFDRVAAAARRPELIPGPASVLRLPFDLEDEPSLAGLAVAAPPPLRTVLCATGLLHDAAMRPEKTLRALDPEQMLRSYRINAVGPALLAKHLLPRFPRDRAGVFAVFGARVGSIADNRSGGWYSYRAAKAALAMLVRCLAIEVARTHPHLVCVGLHPGTVATPLSAPFRAGLAADRVFAPAEAAVRLWDVIDRLVPADSGGVLDWKGELVPA
ncbi:MAG: SDR family NAD(P)-dependent oxidoreductase [Gluconacetobacter diazotrophicus]|nr:SDR family NAD(P)-dependent oxidoreductase [Gluconacetobacter diazotrophicus]